MKTILVLSLVVATLIQSHAQGFGQTNPTASTAGAGQPSAGSGFAAGLLSEEGEGDLAAAVAAYRQTIQAFDRQRDEAANAIFRLGEVYRKLGRMEEAKVQYARILREFPDMVQLTEISHNLLFGEEANRTAGFDWFLGGTHAGTVGIRGGGGVGGGVLGGGGMGVGVGGMPGAGDAATNVTEEGTGYVDHEMSALYGMTVLRAQRSGPKPQSPEEGAGGTAGGSDSADPRSSERIMMQRYGIVPGRVPASQQETGGIAFREAQREEYIDAARDQSKRIACVNNLKQLGLAARIYSADHEGVYPSRIGLMSNEISVTKVLVCPSDSSHQPAESWDAFDPALHLTYQYPGASAREDETQRVLFRCPIHGNVTLGDGSVQQGRSESSAVTPQINEILRRRYGLVGELRTAGTPGANARQPATLAIAINRNGNLTVNGGPMDLAGMTQLIQQMPDEMRAATIIELQADPETESTRIVAVLDACKEAGVSRLNLGTDPSAVIGREIERLKDEYNSLRTELSSIQKEASGLSRQLDQFRPTIDQARARQIQAQERLDALGFSADRLPAVVGQDARYQRLKAEFETAVLDGDTPAQVRTRARLQEWVDLIYRPELESEAELADRRLAASVAEAQEFIEQQQAVQAQQRELQGKLTTSQERMNQLITLLNQTQ